jgi:Carboxylesterase family
MGRRTNSHLRTFELDRAQPDAHFHWCGGLCPITKAISLTSTIVLALIYSASQTQADIGFLDQRLGLEWIRLSIEEFGGDIARIILFG